MNEFKRVTTLVARHFKLLANSPKEFDVVFTREPRVEDWVRRHNHLLYTPWCLTRASWPTYEGKVRGIYKIHGSIRERPDLNLDLSG